MNGESHIPIGRDENLHEYMDKANTKLTSVKWKPSKPLIAQPAKKTTESEYSITQVGQPEMEVSIWKIFQEIISKDTLVLSEDSNHVLHTVRDGICIGFALAKLYSQSAGLELLSQQNSRSGGLKGGQQEEFTQKISTMAAVGIYSTAIYISWALSNYKEDQVSPINLDFPGVPEVYLTNLFMGMDCAIFWYGKFMDKGGIVKTDLQMVKLTLLYFQKLAEEIRTRAGSLKYTEFFTRVSYQLKETEFILKGFEETGSRIIVSTEFNKVLFSEIVGNREAIHRARRNAQRRAAYDPVAKDNPFRRFGGLSDIEMGFGVPGTGKSMIIAATATYLEELCRLVGLPFLFWPLPDNVVSTFQGGSAERMVAWIKRLQDSDKIVYASIDDAENSLEERTRQNSSAGTREVIGVFLRYTEGAYAIKRGNSFIHLFTNLPEQLDKAVLSRIQSRFPIDGARTIEDFFDQDYMWRKKLAEVDEEFAGLQEGLIKGYEPMSNQKQLVNLSQIDDKDIEVTDNRIGDAMLMAKKVYGFKNPAFFAAWSKEVQLIYPSFSSRDDRNIQSSISSRLLDFDMPKPWFEDLELFFRKQFDDKVKMIKALMRENMNGLKLNEIWWREMVKYLNAYSTIVNIERERAITEEFNRLEILTEARARFKKKHGDIL